MKQKTKPALVQRIVSIGRHLALVVAAVAGLIGCDSHEKEVEVSSHQKSVTLRYGESEDIRYITSEPDVHLYWGWYPGLFDFEPGIYRANRFPCVDQDPSCHLITHTVESARTGFGVMDHELFSDNPRLVPESCEDVYRGPMGDRLCVVIRLPATVFPDATQVAPPVVDHAVRSFDSKYRSQGGGGSALALTADGVLWVWGSSLSHNLGSYLGINIPRPIEIDDHIVDFAAPAGFTLAVAEDGSVWGWGDNDHFQLATDDGGSHGYRTFGSLTIYEPFKIEGLSDVVNVAAGADIAAAVRGDGSVMVWGVATMEQFPATGDPLNLAEIGPHVLRDENDTPVQGIVSVVATDQRGLALDSASQVWSFGRHGYADISRRNEDDPNRFTAAGRVFIDEPIQSLAVGPHLSLALATSGRVYSWGDSEVERARDTSGACVAPETGKSLLCGRVPGLVEGLTDVVDISAGPDYALALRADGSVWGWGERSDGVLLDVPRPGVRNTNSLPLLTQATEILPPGSGAHKLSAGDEMVLMTTADSACTSGAGVRGGRLLSWGYPFLQYNSGNTYTTEGKVIPGGVATLIGNRGDGTGLTLHGPTPVLALGDDDTCADETGYRLIVYIKGTGSGTIESNLPGLECLDMVCWQTVTAEDGGQIELNAIPDSDSIFSEWRWDCESSSSLISVTMDRARLCKVHFDQAPLEPVEPEPTPFYTLNVTLSGSGVADGATVISGPAGIDCGTDCSEDYESGTTITLTATAGSTFTEFVGWSGDAACVNGAVNHQTVIEIDRDTNCVANFENVPSVIYTLSVDVIGSGRVTSVELDCPGDCEVEHPSTTRVQLDAIADIGQRFVGWSGDDVCGEGAMGTITSVVLYRDVHCTATFEETAAATISVAVSGAEGRVVSTPVGIDCPDACSATFSEQVLLVAEPGPDSHFVEWSGDVACTQFADGNRTLVDPSPTEGVSCVAVFGVGEPILKYEVSLSVDGMGIIDVKINGADVACDNGCDLLVEASSSIELTAIPDSGRDFIGWKFDCESSGRQSTLNRTVDGPLQCGAEFTTDTLFLYSVSYTVTGSGDGNITNSTGAINCGDGGTACTTVVRSDFNQLQVVATPRADSSPPQWSGGAACTDGFVTIDQDVSCTAIFDLLPSGDTTITATNGGDGHGYIVSTPAGFDSTCSFQGAGIIGPTNCNTQTFVGTTSVTLDALPQDNAVFEGWDGCDATVPGADPGIDSCVVYGPGTREIQVLFVF